MSVLAAVRTEIKVEVAATLPEAEAWRGEWAELWSRVSTATPFQSPDWALAWWRHLGRGDLWVLAFRWEGRLVGLAPLFVYPEPLGARQLLFVGTGVSDYLDALFEPEFAELCLAAFTEHLAGNQHRWDTCDFQQLQPGSGLIAARFPEQWKAELTVQEVCPVLSLPKESADLPRSVPPHMLRKLNYYRRRGQKEATLTLRPAQEADFEEVFEALLSLHRARWSTRGETGMLAESALQEFHREAAQGLLRAGALRLFGLRLGGRIIGSLYGFTQGRRAFFYLSGFAPEFAHLSPGTLLIGHAIEEAVREGLTEFDFLRGREAYKYLWGAKGRLNYRRQVWPPGRDTPTRKTRDELESA